MEDLLNDSNHGKKSETMSPVNESSGSGQPDKSSLSEGKIKKARVEEVQKPKQSRNAYLIWSEDFRRENEELFKQIPRDQHIYVLGKKWREVPEETKEYYKKREGEEHLQYLVAMKQYYSRQPIRRTVGEKIRAVVRKPATPFALMVKDDGASGRSLSGTGDVNDSELIMKSSNKWRNMTPEEKKGFFERYRLKLKKYRTVKLEKMKKLVLEKKKPKKQKKQPASKEAPLLSGIAQTPKSRKQSFHHQPLSPYYESPPAKRFCREDEERPRNVEDLRFYNYGLFSGGFQYANSVSNWPNQPYEGHVDSNYHLLSPAFHPHDGDKFYFQRDDPNSKNPYEKFYLDGQKRK